MMFVSVNSVDAQQKSGSVSVPCRKAPVSGMVNINWSGLELTNEQMVQMESLDNQWQKVQQMVRPKLIRDQQTLRNVITNPNLNEDYIRKLQRDIMLRQEQLRYEATENFLSKRRLLNKDQREKLHKMMKQK